MIALAKEIPDVDVMLALDVEDLALLLLELLQRDSDPGPVNCGNLNNEIWAGNPTNPLYPLERRSEVQHAITEAFMWLQSAVFLIPSDPGNPGHGWYKLGRRAQRMKSADDFAAFRQGLVLPRSLLHDSIAERVRLLHLRGQYDTAVFEAMKQVEVSVRQACGYGDAEIGIQLMRRAFGKEGRLNDPTVQKGEQEALTFLFVGAIGSYKNPQSHRHVKLDAREAAQIILLASHLLTIVEARRATIAAQPPP